MLTNKCRSESDLHSCEPYAVAKKAQKKNLRLRRKSDPVEASDFWGFCLSCFTTAKITFTSILYLTYKCATYDIEVTLDKLS